MPTFKLKRGNRNKVKEYLGTEGEIVFNTDSNEIHIMDGISQGGHSLALTTSGMIAAFAMPTAPSGWLVCDGSAISREQYSSLFSAIGELWGAGDGSTTFNLPDLRGEFLRGWSNSSGNDPDAASRSGGDTVGSSQSSEFGAHTHRPYQTSRTYDNNYNYSGGGRRYGSFGYHYDTTSAGGNETRPRNKYVQYCIRY
jgi:phage-related tail fiber protein